MEIQSVLLENFRNFSRETINPGPGLNVFWGDNAQGKTNLLEAIYVLGNYKSFRGAKSEEMIFQGAKLGHIEGQLYTQRVCHKLSIDLTKEGKKARVNSKEISGIANFLGYLATVLFSPEEVNLVRAFPAGRRALLDRAIFFSYPGFLEVARDYQRHLRQRNFLLRDNRGDAELRPWTEGLIKCGAQVRSFRIDYLNRLRPLLIETYRRICQELENVDLAYVNSGKMSQEEYLAKEIEKSSPREKKLGQTLVGPHRDDPVFLLDGKPMRIFASQGQQRSFILAFKCAQVIDLETCTGESPVLLLDDLTSELDPSRRESFFNFLFERSGQVFLTTTDISPLPNNIQQESKKFRLCKGTVKEDLH